MKGSSLKKSHLELLNNTSLNTINKCASANAELCLESMSILSLDASHISPKKTFKHSKETPNKNTKRKDDAEIKLSDLPWGQRWLTFVDNVSIVGLKYAVDPQASNIHRIVWGIFLLSGIGLMVHQIADRCLYFGTYPKTTDVKHVNEANVRFPTVTICNENLVASSRAQHNDFSDLIATIYPPYPTRIFTPNFTQFEAQFQRLREEEYDWRDMWYYWSHVYTRSDWVYVCMFNGERCGPDDITELVTSMGWCLQFNGREFNYKSSVPGALNGLSLIIDTQQSEYLYSRSRGAGFRILLHSPYEYPSVDFKGLRISPGQATSLSISLYNITQLPAPYGDCEDKGDYDYSMCNAVCAFGYVANQCSCRFWFSDVSGYRTCDPQEQYECADPAYFYFIQNYVSGGHAKACDCRRNCKTMNYAVTHSSNTISNFAMTTLAETFFVNKTCTDDSDSSTCSYTPDLNATVAKLYNNLVDIQVFFDTLTVEDVTEVPRYTILSLFCDIGGAMGLILGSTLLTLAELGEFIAFIIYDVIFFKLYQMYFRFKRRKIQPVHIM